MARLVGRCVGGRMMEGMAPGLSRRRQQRWVLLLLLAFVGMGPLLACFGPEYRSVHFHGLRPDFFQMPQPWRGVPVEKRALPTPREYSRDQEGNDPAVYDPAERPAREQLERAMRWEAAGQFRQAANAWERYRRLRLAADPWAVAEEWWQPLQVQALDDRLAALRAWRSPGDTADLRAYLRARDLVSGGKHATALALLSRLRRPPYERHAEYLRASVRFHMGPPEAAIAAFRSYLRRRPGDALARYMLGRCYFRMARVDEKAGYWKLDSARRRRILQQALAAYESCVAAAPSGPMARDAEGKVAACRFRLGDRVRALDRYCAQLAALPPGRDNHFAFLSARLCLRRMSLAEHRDFQARALSRPDVAAVYLDLNLHFSRPGLRACEHLGRFALDVLERHPDAALSGRLLSRLAVIEGRLGHWERTARLASAAIRRCAPGGYRDQARWLRAQALRQLGRRAASLAEYERLAAGAVAPNMRRGAHEAAAVLSEEGGDRPNALRHYFALEYRPDYGYLIDCLASQEELRAFLRRFPSHPRARLVRYSLGFRQLRTGQYEAAVRTFESLGPWLDVAESAYDCRTSEEQREPRWPPLELARFMAAATRWEAVARTPEEKARVAYSRARVFFRQRYLALYNGALWKGTRLHSLVMQGPYGDYSGLTPPGPAEERAFDRYQREHAPVYQALVIFERIAREYPGTPEAPRSLYSAALCWTFLNRMDPYWSDQGGFSGRAIRCYRRLQREYPNDPLVPAAIKYGGRDAQPRVKGASPDQRSGS